MVPLAHAEQREMRKSPQVPRKTPSPGTRTGRTRKDPTFLPPAANSTTDDIAIANRDDLRRNQVGREVRSLDQVHRRTLRRPFRLSKAPFSRPRDRRSAMTCRIFA
ncbi:LOW QUALITY PROTEIN: hypothetical protein QC761_0102430 [Podospora bellae-mahoneyi]|uniref:Uncharacterized protein n=1 Tax=Podospora bellae-mahoneyi TaxID=2093777 RepID=A0ABR0F5L9_9PEZI|nr:LOW QUALITY PROTEIN: hypothetical protein QC761_0102430 [Podospora bellae-mahoneyi]